MGKLKQSLTKVPIKKPKIEVQVTKKKKTFYRYKLEIMHEDKLLLIGEANFSFSLAIADRVYEGMVCTAYDSRQVTMEKYAEANGNVERLEQDYEATVLFDIDCKKLSKYPELRKQRFSKIIFNFPHVGLGIKDQDENVLANQKLITGFFNEAKQLLKSKKKNDEQDGSIVLTIKSGLPYDLWNVKQLGYDCDLKLDRSMEFVPDDYPGYAHRRTIGHDSKLSAADNIEITKKPSRTYIFKKA